MICGVPLALTQIAALGRKYIDLSVPGALVLGLKILFTEIIHDSLISSLCTQPTGRVSYLQREKPVSERSWHYQNQNCPLGQFNLYLSSSCLKKVFWSRTMPRLATSSQSTHSHRFQKSSKRSLEELAPGNSLLARTSLAAHRVRTRRFLPTTPPAINSNQSKKCNPSR